MCKKLHIIYTKPEQGTDKEIIIKFNYNNKKGEKYGRSFT